jgi:hypothetical protein
LRLAGEACESLERVFSYFPGVADQARTGSDFDPIRDDPMFQKWLEKHEQTSNT